MNPFIIIISISLFVWLLIRAVKKNKDKQGSKLSVLDHPGTFEKPGMEMVSTTFKKEEKTDTTIDVKSLVKKRTNEI
jgi:hypothetical protein